MAGMEIVVDKMHFRGHTDQWCKCHCNPNDFDELKKVTCSRIVMIMYVYTYMYAALTYLLSHCFLVDTEICEQTFSWLSRYARITKHMNKPHFKFYVLYLCDLHNRKKLHH